MAKQSKKFGTFLGVYTPSILTILGLIMYLRFGWVIGNIGLGLTILTVLLASSITFITGLSASAIATNMQVGVGGEYFMISRSLGLELGGAIGIPLYFCRTLSITFYSFGLAEAIIIFWPASWGVVPDHAIQILTIGIILLITLLSGKSASLVLKMQIPIFIIVAISILALIVGVLLHGEFQMPEMTPTYKTAPKGFWYVFAVFFPAVTGFTAGIGMSGDLRNPRKSIPGGTILAVITGVIIYITVPVLISISSKMSPEQLANSGVETWTKIAVFGGILIYPAIWGAILSSGFGSILGGPRVLQALSQDGLAPKFLSKLSKNGQPLIATWVSGGIALLAVLMGGLNTVAQFVSVLFLTLYVMINMSAVIEKIVADPSFRPTIKVPWFISLLGALGSIGVMFLINPWACMGAIILETALYIYLSGKSLHKRWGDVRAGIWLATIRFSLMKIKSLGKEPRNWRPKILLFVKDINKQINLVKLASWFGQNHGIVTTTKLIIDELDKTNIDIHDEKLKIETVYKENNLTAFSEIVIVPEFEIGAVSVSQANGIGGVKSNTIMFSWSENHERLVTLQRIIRSVAKVGKSTVLAKLDNTLDPKKENNIDLWWGGQQRNGDLMLILAYLLKLNNDWKEANITIRTVVESEEEKYKMQKKMKLLIPESRIKSDIEIIVNTNKDKISKIIQEYSNESDIVFLGLKITDESEEEGYANYLNDLTGKLKTVIFVNNPGSTESSPVLLKI